MCNGVEFSSTVQYEGYDGVTTLTLSSEYLSLVWPSNMVSIQKTGLVGSPAPVPDRTASFTRYASTSEQVSVLS